MNKVRLLKGNEKNRAKITEWAAAISVTLGSVFICIFCCMVWGSNGRLVKEVQIIVAPVLITINLSAYYLHYRIKIYDLADRENKILKQQNEYVRISYEAYEDQWSNLSKLRHDLKNSCVLEMDYLEKGRYDLLMAHYQKQVGAVKNREKFIYTGNIGIDSIVNFKLNTAKRMHIAVEKTIQITGQVSIDHIDLNILIGNLMDNAMEAAKGMDSGKRKISLVIRTDKTAFFMEINNGFKGERARNEEGDFLTNKREKKYHGIGLKSVKGIVKKYDGQMTIYAQKSEFCIKVLIYMDSQL